MPKTPGYQPTNFNDVISQISPQHLKTSVLEDHLVSRLNNFLPPCQSPVNVRSNVQNETEIFFETKNQIKRFSESSPNEKDIKETISVLENENDNTFESECNSSTTECSNQVDQSSNEKTNRSTLRTNLLIKQVCNYTLRVHLLANFLAQKCPDIYLFDELKIDLSEANIYLNFHNYQFITQPHNKYGGGVAILIEEGIEFI
ncbi:hypothetical protein BpHYR1_048431 [Brachionus plicatilis]|uniref:RNA-directed DNA polymerase from mobile element jockey-like n=1 Tax=Brachionus plicatilis TaxID=10195 RepID=A0A3M7SS64_BRAPC|nr:hypothetical protein BpHYR1_048431 [Brachionus plicatilis]